MLHQELYKSLNINTSEDWKFCLSCIDPRELLSSEVAIEYISTFLSRRFEVSSEVIKRRIKNEGLMG